MADSISGLEYHLNLPQSITKDFVNNKDKDDFVFVYDKEKLPVVILFGWAGCLDRHLAKYSAIYEERGCITLRCIVSPLVIFLRPDKLPHIAKKILDLLHELSLDEHPVFFHIFSNGGAFFYQYVSQEMQKDDRMLQVKGAIFDSGPGERKLFPVFVIMSNIIGGFAWIHTPGTFLITVIVFMGLMLFAYLKGLIEGKKPVSDPTMLEDEPFTWPQCFIYSTNDDLIMFGEIEKFASAREKKGVKVKRCFLDKSRHVRHLIYHKDDYINTSINFVQDCLKENKSAK